MIFADTRSGHLGLLVRYAKAETRATDRAIG